MSHGENGPEPKKRGEVKRSMFTSHRWLTGPGPCWLKRCMKWDLLKCNRSEGRKCPGRHGWCRSDPSMTICAGSVSERVLLGRRRASSISTYVDFSLTNRERAVKRTTGHCEYVGGRTKEPICTGERGKVRNPKPTLLFLSKPLCKPMSRMIWVRNPSYEPFLDFTVLPSFT